MQDHPILLPRETTKDALATGLIEGDAGTISHRPTWRPATAPTALAVTSLAAAGLHFAVMGDHFAEGLPIGVFFAVVACFQALWAVGIAVSASRPLDPNPSNNTASATTQVNP